VTGAVTAVARSDRGSDPTARPARVVATSTAPSAAPAIPKARKPKPKPVVKPKPKPKPPARPLYAIPAPPVQPQPCPVPYRGPGGNPKPIVNPPGLVPDSELPAILPAPKRAVDLAPIRAKGLWIYRMERTENGNAGAIVRRAKAAGLRSIWVRTGGTRQGYYGDPILAALLPAAHRAGIKVIAWDFAFLYDPAGDAERARRALSFRTSGGDMLDAFAPDIETLAERVLLTERRVQIYLGLVRRYAGNRPVIATVPRPTDKRLASYPYEAMSPWIDAWAPMVYWSCNEPGKLVLQSMQRLAKWHPVHLVGQAYDMGSEGGRPGNPRGAETWRFLDAGKRNGAVGVSFYVWQETTDEQWRALAAYPWR
jgi:hypothetical protein